MRDEDAYTPDRAKPLRPGNAMTIALADVVLFIHALVVLFIVGGFAAILIGASLGWRWIREPRFRLAHLCAIAVVAALALLGVPCPLTTLEARLRNDTSSAQGCIAYWVGRMLYYDLPNWVFTAAYAAFAIAVLLTWRFIAPRKLRWSHRSE